LIGNRLRLTGFVGVALLLWVPAALSAPGLPLVNIIDAGDEGTRYSLSIQVLVLMTVLTLLPSILLMMTSFVRIVIVMSLLRQALGTAQTPPNQVLIGLSLFLTFFIMSPVIDTVYEKAYQPYLNETISAEQAIDQAQIPIRAFMLNQTRQEDIAMFAEIANYDSSLGLDKVPFTVLAPAFLTSELKTAFTIGFLIYIPFVVIDLVVASVLMSMGMMMLSPMMISMPFKLMLFVVADGWSLLMQSLVSSFLVT
jgi:flagellar biosynthesis protein FliP